LCNQPDGWMGFILLGFFWTEQIQQNKLSPYRYIIFPVGVMVVCCVSRVLFLHTAQMVFLSRVLRFWGGCGVVGVVECIPHDFSRCARKIAG